VLALALALSVLVGLSLGLLGGGGSILTLPILRYALGMEAHQAIAVSLFVVGSTSLAALVPHARAGRVRYRTGVALGLAGMVGAFGAGRIARFVPSGVLLTLFGALMFTTAIAMLRGRRDPGAGRAAGDVPLASAIAKGLAIGAVSGLVGAGGGFLVVPALVLFGGLAMEVAVGTSLLVIAMQSFAGLAGHLGSVTIPWTLTLATAGIAVVGSVVGGQLVHRVSPSVLRRAFAWLVVAMAFFVLAQELPRALGAPWAMGVVLVVTAAGTGLVALVERAARLRAPEPSTRAT
jgi:uncharacterized membrane protein YfcA